MKELPATLLLRPLGGDTLAVAVWQATSESLFETAALPALLIVLVGLAARGGHDPALRPPPLRARGRPGGGQLGRGRAGGGMNAVELDGVSRSFGPVRAVRDLSLEVRRGELMAVLGPSGCGKTTLLRLIAGFERPDAGSITVGDTTRGRARLLHGRRSGGGSGWCSRTTRCSRT